MGRSIPLVHRSRPLRLLAGLAVLALTAVGCGGEDGDDDTVSPETTAAATTTAATEEPEVQTGGSLTIGIEAETNNWLPGVYQGADAGANIAVSIYDSLMARGADGDVHPMLAESVVPNDDLTEWTVTLRPGITMHDGTELNAELMKTIFDEYLTVDGATTAASLSKVESVRVDDELTYTYVLTETHATFPEVLTGAPGWPFSVAACEARGGRLGDCGLHPVGAGPFKLVSWTRDDRLVLERNPDYWRTDANGIQLPYLDELIFRPIPDEDSRLQSVISGTIDVGQTLRQSLVRQAREADGIVSYEFIGDNGGGSIFNTLVPPVDDVRVRRGLVYALDQDALIEILGGKDITPSQTQFYSPDSPWFSQAVADVYPTYDTDKATELLSEYVNDPNRSDGKAVGEPIAVEFNCPPDPSLLDLAQAYQQFWSAVGVEVQLNAVEQSIHIQNAIDADGDPPFRGRFMINCWRAGGGEPYNALRAAFGDPTIESLNFTNYTSDIITENLEVLRTSADFDERYAAVEAIMMDLAENLPQLWTGGTAIAYYALPAVRNLTTWTLPDAEGNATIPAQISGGSLRWSEVWVEQ